jgi:hypothetical protein
VTCCTFIKELLEETEEMAIIRQAAAVTIALAAAVAEALHHM